MNKASFILAGKLGSRRHSNASFSECRSSGNKLSKVKGFSILQSGEGLTSFNNDNSATFWRENLVAVAILMRVLASVVVAETSYQRLKVLAFYNNDNSATFSGKKRKV